MRKAKTPWAALVILAILAFMGGLWSVALAAVLGVIWCVLRVVVWQMERYKEQERRGQ